MRSPAADQGLVVDVVDSLEEGADQDRAARFRRDGLLALIEVADEGNLMKG